MIEYYVIVPFISTAENEIKKHLLTTGRAVELSTCQKLNKCPTYKNKLTHII